MKRIFSNKEIVLGVTGSIAAYKACEIASRLVEYGAHVLPVLTESAAELVAPASFEAITGRRAITKMFEPLENPEIEHIAVATRASLFLIAPATANVLAKAAHGIADDWLTTTLLATRAPILFAPAMNCNMYTHPATHENIQTLARRGCRFVGPEEGRLACGATGIGRMIDPAAVIEACVPLLGTRKDLAGKKVLITSGANHEPIDPVRFIGNRSSGKMGRAIALEALARGAEVTIISGPSEVRMPWGATVVSVRSAAEMAQAVEREAPNADVIIGAAAVADYRVENPAADKIKREKDKLTLTLVQNPDIIAAVAAKRRAGQVIVGFAAETENLIPNAIEKLKRKNLDLIVANLVGTPESDFGTDTVSASLITPDRHIEDLPVVTKEELAEHVFNHIAQALAQGG